MSPVTRAVAVVVPLAVATPPVVRYVALSTGMTRHVNFAVGFICFLLFTLAGYLAAPDGRPSRGAVGGVVVAVFAFALSWMLMPVLDAGSARAEWRAVPLMILILVVAGAVMGQAGARLRSGRVSDNTPTA